MSGISDRRIGEASDGLLFLIDGDILAFRCAAATDGRHYMVGEDGPFGTKKEALKYCKDFGFKEELIVLHFTPEPISHTIQLMKNYLLKMPNRKIFLSDKKNFRYDLFPEYKAQRKTTRRPHNLEEAKEYLFKHQKAGLAPHMEADDLLVIESTYLDHEGTPHAIASSDKDLLQKHGMHYNFIKDEFNSVSKAMARRNFWIQVCAGDATDGIVSPPRLGPKKGAKYLDARVDWEVSSDHEIWGYLTTLYADYIKAQENELHADYVKRVYSWANQVASLVYLLKDYDDEWTEPEAKAEETKEDSKEKEDSSVASS